MNRERNTSTVITQVTHNEKHGNLMRKPREKYFRQMTGRDFEFIKRIVIVDANDVPECMIRLTCRKDGYTTVMCAGCGKMFRKSEMDGALCRGVEGCSINAELGYMTHGHDGRPLKVEAKPVTVFNTLPFGGVCGEMV